MEAVINVAAAAAVGRLVALLTRSSDPTLARHDCLPEGHGHCGRVRF